jgi:hypothetical protein
MIKITIGILNKRHEEVMREKESKILGLEFQLITSTNEKATQAEKIVQLEKEKDELYEQNMGLKRENADVELRELVHRATGVIEEQDQNINNLQVEIVEAKKSLKSAREVKVSLRGTVEGQLHRNKRIAKTLLATVMELGGDVAIPGKQRPFPRDRYSKARHRGPWSLVLVSFIVPSQPRTIRCPVSWKAPRRVRRILSFPTRLSQSPAGNYY